MIYVVTGGDGCTGSFAACLPPFFVLLVYFAISFYFIFYFHLAAFKLLTQLKLEKYNCSGFNVCNMHFFRYDFKRSVSHTSAHARCIVVSAQSST